MTASEDSYALALGIASWWVACALRNRERARDAERGHRMQRVRDKKLAQIHGAWPAETQELEPESMLRAEDVLSAMDLDRDTRRTLLIDLLFSDPFAPYEVKFSQKDLRTSLGWLAEHLGFTSGEIDELAEIRTDATKAHRRLSIGRVVAFGIGGAVVLGLGGWMAAPLVAGYLGAGAGLAGAAATAHGLALLGGGTVAAGGMGVAGGMIVVTGVGAAAGGVAGTGGVLLFQMGAAAAENELIKLQVTYKAVLLRNQAQTSKAQEVIRGLAQRESEVRSLLTEERLLNDANARKLKELEEILESIEDSREWMIQQQRSA